MLSLLSSFRLARRVRPFRSFSSTRVSRDTQSPDPEDPEDLLRLVEQTEAQFSGTNIRRWDPKRLVPMKPNKIVIPYALTLRSRLIPYKSRRKTSPLGFFGPPAAASRRLDPFYQLGLDPLRECFNPNLLSGYVTYMGKIRLRADNHLTWRSQRRLTKAIKRAKMMGIMPRFSKRALPSGY